LGEPAHVRPSRGLSTVAIGTLRSLADFGRREPNLDDMTIQRIRARNFKSFQSLDVQLRPFNVIIGANASGKSNLISVLAFLRSIPAIGFLSAVRAQGGQGLLGNIRSKTSTVEITVESRNPLAVMAAPFPTTEGMERAPSGGFVESSYQLRLDAGTIRMAPRVIEERLSLRFTLVSRRLGARHTRSRSVARIVLARRGASLRLQSSRTELTPPAAAAFISYLNSVRRIPIPPSVCLLDHPLTEAFVLSMFPDLFGGSFYSLEPSKEKQPTSPIGRPVLSVDGSNLAAVLSPIVQDPRGKKRFLNLARDFLPFIEDIRVTDNGANLLLELLESSSGGKYLPAGALSDGTVNILAWTVALYFEQKPLLIFEEPERCLHPQLLSRVIDATRSLSSDAQVIITTHSPEVVRHSELASLLLLTRDRDGNSILSRPANVNRVKRFLRDNLGVSDLFLLNQLS
jgi:predicted ATPase